MTITYRELSSLEQDLGVDARTLYGVSNNISRHYRPAEIPKGDGSVRRLWVPDEPLKSIQRKIARVLLSPMEVSPHATAYRYGAGIVKNARAHVGQPRVLTLDIFRFFDHVRYSAVKEKAFPADRYCEANRILLTLLCYYREGLPQGAPTSPWISNLILKEMDDTLGAWCGERGIVYTRYCDDMTFSGDFDEKEVIKQVSTMLVPYGFRLNHKKTKVFKASQRQTVTGIVVNQKENVSKDYKREIRKEVFFCQKHGVEEHLHHEMLDISPSQYLNKLLGKINFVLQVSPQNKEFTEYKNIVLNLLNNQ